MDTSFWFSSAVLIGILLASFYNIFRNLKRARIIEDAATANIASAAQGYVGLKGRAVAGENGPLLSPLTQTECCWYTYRKETRFEGSWVADEWEPSEDPLVIEDETGRCRIDHQTARVTPRDREMWEHCSGRSEKRRRGSGKALKDKRILGYVLDFDEMRGNAHDGATRCIEERIQPGDPVYVMGQFRSLDERDHEREIKQQTGELLKKWKTNPRMLARLDRDGDGKLSAKEWEAAQRAAEANVRKRHEEKKAHRMEHSIIKPALKEQPFLISTLNENDLTKRYRGEALVSFVAFLVGLAGGWAYWF